jgi:hypothetical protein
MRLEGIVSLARLISVTSTGGIGGITQPPGQSGYPEPSGVPLGWPSGPYPFVDLGPIGRSMSIATDPIRESTSAALTLTGQPGDRAGIFVSSAASSVFNAGWNGQQLFPWIPSPTFIDGGIVPAGGTLLYNLPFPDLGAGVAAKTFMIQPVFSSATVRLVLGTAVPLLVLDSAY